MVLCNSRKVVTLFFIYSGSISWFMAVMIVAKFLEHFCLGICNLMAGSVLSNSHRALWNSIFILSSSGFSTVCGLSKLCFSFCSFSLIGCVISLSVFLFPQNPGRFLLQLSPLRFQPLVLWFQGFVNKFLATMALCWSAVRCSLTSISGYSLVNMSCNSRLYPIFIVSNLLIM
jgi:hypothetical protein